MNVKIKKVLSTISPNFTTRLMFLYNFKKPLNLRNPKDINEKLQYLKLKTYYNNPIITQCVDKSQVRNYLEKKGMSDLSAELYAGPFENAEDILSVWDKLPQKFVIKCNHGCGYNILVTEKDVEDKNRIVGQLKVWLKEDFWKVYCEPQYRFVPKRVIIEEYLADDIKTYKFYCFNGVPKISYISSNGENGEKDLYLDYFDMDWVHQDISLDGHQHSKNDIPKPLNFDGMVKIAEQLSADFPFVRVDLYNVDGKIYFSELTFIPTGGNMKLKPKSILDEWGSWLKL